MDKLDAIRHLLGQIGMPPKQQNMTCALSLLAMANITDDTKWEDATNNWVRIHDIITFAAENYGIVYAENTRETIRKQAIHPFRTAAVIEDNGKATNSPNYRYRITPEFLEVIRGLHVDAHIHDNGNNALKQFIATHESLSAIYESKKKMQKMPVRINNSNYQFSPGKHNQLQKAIIEEFAPRFAPGAECLYVGDTIQKDMVKNVSKLKDLGFEITLHDKMPDVILYREDKDWIYFIEAITSVGPMDSKRVVEIDAMTRDVNSGKIYISAFLDFATYRKFSNQLAWETEVWIADMPEHMIHLNGNKFLGPR